MAEAKKEAAEKKEEKIFTVPLRKAFRTERTRRAKKAIALIEEFLLRHMKADKANIGKSINESLWARGIQKPPRRIRIHATKQEGTVFAELVGTEIKAPTAEELKKKSEKEREKEDKIKEERKERRKKTIQEEIKEESGKPAKEAPQEKTTPQEKPEQ